MNLTLGTLASLKAYVLPEEERTSTQWDGVLVALGNGCAGAMEQLCRRKFGRVVGDTYECSADRAHVVLPRYPIEAISKIEIRRSLTEGWVELTNEIENYNLEAGIVYFGSQLGTHLERLRITYTGGYWLDESDDGSVSDESSSAWKQGTITLTENAETVTVTFPEAFAAVPAVNPVVISPSGGVMIFASPQGITVSGCTVRLGFPVPGAGYQLQWTAFLAQQAPAPSSGQPTGSTAVPRDLSLAWLQQSAHLWRQKDKLGAALAQNNGEVAATRIEMQEGVLQLLQPYRRLSVLG